MVGHLHDGEAVLVVDEMGDVKKGTDTVGVQRQYTGTAGRIENAQVAVYLVYASRRGYAAVDRKLYVPRSWTSDPDRCRAAGLGDNTKFATKPELAARMVTRCLDAGHRAAWVAGDEVYGGNPRLRTALEERGTGYVLAVACSHEATTGAAPGGFAPTCWPGGCPRGPGRSCPQGPEPRATASMTGPSSTSPIPRPGSRQLLIRRNRSTGERAYYRCYSPAAVPLTTLVCVAGSRWRVEEFFQSGEGLAALDEHQVRRYPSWSRWVALAMLAHAFLVVLCANEHEGHCSPDELIPLTCDEIQRLFITLVNRTVFDPVHRLRWSLWRRRHQARSQTSHYRRQAAQA